MSWSPSVPIRTGPAERGMRVRLLRVGASRESNSVAKTGMAKAPLHETRRAPHPSAGNPSRLGRSAQTAFKTRCPSRPTQPWHGDCSSSAVSIPHRQAGPARGCLPKGVCTNQPRRPRIPSRRRRSADTSAMERCGGFLSERHQLQFKQSKRRRQARDFILAGLGSLVHSPGESVPTPAGSRRTLSRASASLTAELSAA